MNNGPKTPVNINIDYDATKLVDSVITKPASSVGDTLVSAWSMTFGWIDYFNEKSLIRRKANLVAYQNSVNLKLNLIPEENLQEPSMSIIGPAIKSSEFYFEEDHYRDMFSSLIASSFNTSKNESIHPSFATVITELSKNDALVFKEIFNHQYAGYFPVTRCLINNTRGFPINKYLYDLHLLKGTFDFNSTIMQSISIKNLERLGLINLDWSKTYDKSVYTFFDKNFEVIQIRKTHGNDIVSPQNGVTSITNYGQAFFEVCLG